MDHLEEIDNQPDVNVNEKSALDYEKNYIRPEMEELCKSFYFELEKELADTYTRHDTINGKHFSSCLIPNGTEEELSYYGKPEFSFRCADRWNWHSTKEKCDNPKYVQCFTRDLINPKRVLPGQNGTKPIRAKAVAIYYDGEYHIVYGQKFDQKLRRWYWMDNDVEGVLGILWYEQHKKRSAG